MEREMIKTAKDAASILDHGAVLRTRSDSTPLRGTSDGGALGDAHLSKRWRSWSFPHAEHGIPLGSLTAREAARPFWNPCMLQERLEKIVEYALSEAPASPTDSDIVEFSLDVDALDLQQSPTPTNDVVSHSLAEPTTEHITSPTHTSHCAVVPAQPDNEGSGVDDSCTASVKPLAARSAPLLHPLERSFKPFPITTIFSQSTSVL